MRKEHVKPSVVPVLCTVVFCFLLTGCGWMRGSGGCDKNKGYLDSREEPTLGVPSDLTEPDYGLGVNIPETREPSETVVEEGGCLESPPDINTDQQGNQTTDNT